MLRIVLKIRENTKMHVFFRTGVIAGFFLFLGCEQFIGYNYDADVEDNTIRISGRVRNIFTDEPVAGALVQIGIQQTLTDYFGDYILHVDLGTDEERDKPVPVTVTAEKYDAFEDQFVIYNEDKEYVIKLVYVAPIIKEASIYPTSSLLNCDVRIYDYQGFADIKTVQATFYYIKDFSPDMKRLDMDLEFVKFITPLSALYRCKILSGLGDGWHLPSKDNYYYIFAEDQSGNSDYRRFK